jgi:preprotein translocase subunit SecY
VDKLYTILFKVPELQRKILMTAMFLAIYRIGYFIPLHVVDQARLAAWAESQSQTGMGKVLGTLSMLGGSQIGMSTIFGLGIMPYISASIIFQLLGSVVPSLEAMMKEGESGRKKINELTRYLTVPICMIQSLIFVQTIMRPEGVEGMGLAPQGYAEGWKLYWFGASAIITMTAGTVFLMWLGEQIDEYGIGNGISLIIMAGIVARIPDATISLLFNPAKPAW